MSTCLLASDRHFRPVDLAFLARIKWITAKFTMKSALVLSGLLFDFLTRLGASVFRLGEAPIAFSKDRRFYAGGQPTRITCLSRLLDATLVAFVP